jgi:hypothetical protein
MKFVADRILDLKSMALHELVALPNLIEGEAFVEDGKTYRLITWHDNLEPELHRIVVGAYRSTVFGLGTHICADGFAIDDQGNKRPLSSEELSPFR